MKPSTQIVRYAFVGVCNTLVHLAVVLIVLNIIGLGQMVANSIAYVVSSIFSFFMNSKWSFRQKPNSRNFSRFQVVTLVGLLVSSGIGFAGDYFNWNFIVTVLYVAVAVPFVSFMLHRKYTFTR